MLIFDNHLHLRRNGKGVQAVKEFERAGGHMILCQLPMVERVIEERSYLPCYQETLALADEAMAATQVTVYVSVGPYPVDYLGLRDRFDRDGAMAIMRRGMEQAQQLCIDGDAVTIGEIGRPHFHVDEQTWRDSNALLRYGMELAAGAGVPVVLHTESMGPPGFRELAAMADDAGLAREKVVKHFSPPLVARDENHGLVPSVLANEDALRAALKKGHRFVMETDYIDDASRPGAVLGPKTVPRRTRQLREAGVRCERHKKQHVITIEGVDTDEDTKNGQQPKDCSNPDNTAYHIIIRCFFMVRYHGGKSAQSLANGRGHGKWSKRNRG